MNNSLSRPIELAHSILRVSARCSGAAWLVVLSTGCEPRPNQSLPVERKPALLQKQNEAEEISGQGKTVNQPPRLVTMSQVVTRLPHDPGGSVQGLYYSGGRFIESTGGYGQSSLRVVDVQSGDVLIKKELPPHIFGEGCAPIPNRRIVQLTWRNQIAYVYDDENLELIATLPYPREGWGLIYNGHHLIASDGSHRLYWLDPETLQTLRELEVRSRDQKKVARLNEMAWVEGKIMANIFLTNLIVEIDPKTGIVERSWDLTPIVQAENPRDFEHVLNGIAYDPGTGRLWITGKCWKHVYQLEGITR